MDIYISSVDNVTSTTKIILPEWQEAKGNIYPMVRQSVPRSGQFPVCDKFLDLFICYSIRLARQEDNARVPLLVNNKMLEKWRISRQEMARQAMGNMKNDGYKITSICEILKAVDNGVQPELPFPFYVLTNWATLYGAAGILNHGMISGFAKKMGSDLFLIPSSIHEILLLPDDGWANIEGLNRMVMEVNDTQVEPCERLSNHVYHYNRELDKIEIPM